MATVAELVKGFDSKGEARVKIEKKADWNILYYAAKRANDGKGVKMTARKSGDHAIAFALTGPSAAKGKAALKALEARLADEPAAPRKKKAAAALEAVEKKPAAKPRKKSAERTESGIKLNEQVKITADAFDRKSDMVGATGKLIFIDERNGKGHVLVESGKGSVSVVVDLAGVKRAAKKAS